ncbi:DUF2156 domain-containing protein [Pseudodesulfovibrio piezophilus]|uniref:Phosphatidylglycerol lysyltransferase C-terminal domain-containing protein n=1 Tax=Pseudodesulfovibrio piezophilus (strain DSM 21447 / JCM 15486 / C1TLV30) TaxID=1322246 RepID=M1WLC3_PSEP2|nr:phosphatidylglycerol lysyltransferase domain-containing protein [Pseudodesulfovibrio piezophilus]CCH47615.1 conserved protein of unknown function [Pseudodesulfovibrio piezophilus C1TLV30]
MTLDFGPISLDRQDDYHIAMTGCPQLMTSDFSFANIFGWAEHYGLEWAFHKDLCFIRQTRPEVIYWAPVGPWDKYAWVDCSIMKEAQRFTRVPEALANHWEKAYGSAIKLTENRGHWDYIYSVEELIALKGKKFHKKKNLLNQFIKNSNFQYESMRPECVEEVLEMQDEWYKWYEENNPSEAIKAENHAITRVMLNFDQIKGLMGATLRVDGKVIAYTVAEPLCDDSIVIHFEKGDIRHKGVYQAINQMFLKNDADTFTNVNREQDLGDEGLRKAKLSYNPSFFLKKFEAIVS